jgi:outer membrane protein assembly factor BamA
MPTPTSGLHFPPRVNGRRRALRPILHTALLAAALAGCAPHPAPKGAPSPPTLSAAPASRSFRALCDGAPCSVKVVLEGNQRIPSSTLFPLLGILGATEVTDEILERDAMVLQARYYDEGHLSIAVTPEQTMREGEATIRFLIHEGPRYTLARFDVFEKIDGQKRPPEGGWKSSLRVHRIFDRREMLLEINWLTRIYQDMGYADVEARPSLDMNEAKLEVAVDVPVVRGPLSAFGKIHFDGLHAVRDQDLVGLGFSPGDRFSTRALVYAKKRLLALDWFYSVDISTAHGEGPGIVDVTFTVAERPRAPTPQVLADAR